MATTITHSLGAISPHLVEGFEAVRDTRTVVHPILGNTLPDVTLREPGSRRGTFRCLFADQADALTAEAVLAVPQVLTISDPDVPSLYMVFVVAGGEISLALDVTRSFWWLSVPFVEIENSPYSPPLYPSSGLFPGGS